MVARGLPVAQGFHEAHWNEDAYYMWYEENKYQLRFIKKMPQQVEYLTRAEEYEWYPALATEEEINEFYDSQTNWLDAVPMTRFEHTVLRALNSMMEQGLIETTDDR